MSCTAACCFGFAVMSFKVVPAGWRAQITVLCKLVRGAESLRAEKRVSPVCVSLCPMQQYSRGNGTAQANSLKDLLQNKIDDMEKQVLSRVNTIEESRPAPRNDTEQRNRVESTLTSLHHRITDLEKGAFTCPGRAEDFPTLGTRLCTGLSVLPSLRLSLIRSIFKLK